MSFFSKVVETYRQTSKPQDILWNRLIARPLASVVLVPLSHTSITPNQITFASFIVFVVAACLIALWPGWLGIVIAVAVLEGSYVLDCVDGQLARKKGLSSPIGAYLDFLMDELKAFLLVAATGVRLWQAGNEPLWLLEALLGLCAVASGIGLTTFIRRPEVMHATGRTITESAGDYGEGFAAANTKPVHRSPLAYLEGFGKFLIHYPSYLLFIAIANRMDLFLHVYVAIHAAYAARLLTRIFLKLGKTVS